MDKNRVKKITVTKVLAAAGILLIAISAGFLSFPAVNNYLANRSYKEITEAYVKNVDTLSNAEVEDILSAAVEYNENLADRLFNQYDYDSSYDEILSFDDGIIGYVEIPKIDVKLPIYHGTSDEVLKKGAGHLPYTSFPIGGESTHAVISAHTGYPNKIFFDKLDEIEIGDVFYIDVLNQTLAYEVCDINIVDPDDTSLLEIEEGEDLVSLVTCYPYAVNTHRLIVTGRRAEASTSDEATEDESKTDSDNYTELFSSLIFIPLVFAVVFLLITITKRKKKQKTE